MEEKILEELKSINEQIKGFDGKLQKQKEEICSEFDERLQKQKEEIYLKLDKQKEQICLLMEDRLLSLRDYIMGGLKIEFKQYTEHINDKENEMMKEFREHKVKTLKRIRVLENVLVH